VQTAFLAGLLGAEAAPERPVTLSLRRSGRVDLLVLPSGGEVAVVVRYLDVYIDDLRQGPGPSAPGQWDSVSGVLLYPRRPTDPVRSQLIEQIADREALMVVWFDETDWM
jgi:poly(3-hydroxybutyrate) depolymerase